MEIIISVFVVLAGLYLMIGAILRWDWMYQNHRARAVVQMFGMRGARVIYAAIGVILVLGIPVIRVLRWIDLYEDRVQGNGRSTVQENLFVEATPDFSVTLSVEPDGCTVSRSEVTGSSQIVNLQWKVTNQSGETVLGRAAEGEYRYQYYRPGAYHVVLQTWYNGAYIDIGNGVIINCP